LRAVDLTYQGDSIITLQAIECPGFTKANLWIVIPYHGLKTLQSILAFYVGKLVEGNEFGLRIVEVAVGQCGTHYVCCAIVTFTNLPGEITLALILRLYPGGSILIKKDNQPLNPLVWPQLNCEAATYKLLYSV
tara:strand:+ start:4313 stop:4714 length:402 start_codon:yes stop_codon:yes gene_type:complete